MKGERFENESVHSELGGEGVRKEWKVLHGERREFSPSQERRKDSSGEEQLT